MSLKRVVDSAWLSSLAHLDESGIKKRLPERGYGFIDFFDLNHNQGYKCYDEKNQKDQVIVFRETEDIFKPNGTINLEGIYDWGENIDYFPIDTKYGILHNGFYEFLNDNRERLIEGIEDKDFFSIGFSKAGSFSRMFSKIMSKNPDKKDIFNPYKPFFIAFEPAQESKTKNYYTNGIWTQKGNDIVTMLPLKFTGWHQSGEAIYITGRSNRVIINPKKLERTLLVASDTVMDGIDKFSMDDILRDHNIENIKTTWESPKNMVKIINLAVNKFGIKE